MEATLGEGDLGEFHWTLGSAVFSQNAFALWGSKEGHWGGGQASMTQEH